MMRMAFIPIVAAGLCSCSQQAGLDVRDAWTRATPGRAANAAVFMTIQSPVADRLTGASAAIARQTDLMTMTSPDGAMKMAYLEAIDVPADDPVSLDPNGLHVWLAGLRQPLKAGDSFTLTLHFERAGNREILVPVLAPSAAAPGSASQR